MELVVNVVIVQDHAVLPSVALRHGGLFGSGGGGGGGGTHSKNNSQDDTLDVSARDVYKMAQL